MKKLTRDCLVNDKIDLKLAIKLLEKNSEKCLIVVDSKDRLKGTITDGDVRRAIVKGFNLNSNIKSIYKKNPIKIFSNKFDKIKNYNDLFNQIDNYRVIPIINKKKQVVSLIKWTNSTNNKKKLYNNFKNIDVVIMSGGEGKRLLPYTNIIPKPLVSVNNKAIIEHIIEKFTNLGISNFYFTVGYKMNLIKAYFRQKKNKFKINFISEKKPLGTAGALAFLDKKIKKDFFLTNCDSIINANYQLIYKFHSEKKLDLTIVSSKKIHHVPYGTCILNSKGLLVALKEKPTYNFLVNTGFYVLTPSVLKLIKKNEYLDMDKFINSLLAKRLKVGVYTLPDKSWLDFGQWDSFDSSAKLMSEI